VCIVNNILIKAFINILLNMAILGHLKRGKGFVYPAHQHPPTEDSTFQERHLHWKSWIQTQKSTGERSE
jgi:hypothetical protein